MSRRLLILTIGAFAAVFAGTVATGGASASCVTSPAITSAAAVGQSQVNIAYTGVCGSTVKVKEKRSGSCGPVAGCNAYYFDTNTGNVTVTSVFGPGPSSFRVCDISGPTDVCSAAWLLTVQ